MQTSRCESALKQGLNPDMVLIFVADRLKEAVVLRPVW